MTQIYPKRLVMKEMAAKALTVNITSPSPWFPNLASHSLSIPTCTHNPYSYSPVISSICHAKKKNSSKLEPLLKPSNTQNIKVEEEEEGFDSIDEFDENAVKGQHKSTAGSSPHVTGEISERKIGELIDEDIYEDEEEEVELSVGDGAGGGGISLAGTEWDKKALAIAENTLLSFNGELRIYAFKTLKNSTIQVRIEKLSNRSGSPSMGDIEEFSSAYRAQLDEAEEAGSIPKNTSLEVSSPGVERVVQIPQDLDRFKDRPMYVKYVTEETESDGVLKLVSFDLESSFCTWGIADVKINREKAGKGRPLNKKQRDWRLITPFHSLRLVRIYSDI